VRGTTINPGGNVMLRRKDQDPPKLTAGKTLFPLVVLDESDNGFFSYQSVVYDSVQIAGRERSKPISQTAAAMTERMMVYPQRAYCMDFNL
jgi:hypothetical protein